MATTTKSKFLLNDQVTPFKTSSRMVKSIKKAGISPVVTDSGLTGQMFANATNPQPEAKISQANVELEL